MKIEVTDTPEQADDDFIIHQTREYNRGFLESDAKPLSILFRDDSEQVIAGLTGRSFWGFLHIEYLWVSEDERGNNLGSKLMRKAEEVACERNCVGVTLDTFSFQALGFYQKLGYSVIGRLNGYTDGHQRHYLSKRLPELSMGDIDTKKPTTFNM